MAIFNSYVSLPEGIYSGFSGATAMNQLCRYTFLQGLPGRPFVGHKKGHTNDSSNRLIVADQTVSNVTQISI